MSKPTVRTEVENGRIRAYICPIDGRIMVEQCTEWDGTGFTKFLCPGCETILDDDPFNQIAYEQGES